MSVEQTLHEISLHLGKIAQILEKDLLIRGGDIGGPIYSKRTPSDGTPDEATGGAKPPQGTPDMNVSRKDKLEYIRELLRRTQLYRSDWKWLKDNGYLHGNGLEELSDVDLDDIYIRNQPEGER